MFIMVQRGEGSLSTTSNPLRRTRKVSNNESRARLGSDALASRVSRFSLSPIACYTPLTDAYFKTDNLMMLASKC